MEGSGESLIFIMYFFNTWNLELPYIDFFP